MHDAPGFYAPAPPAEMRMLFWLVLGPVIIAAACTRTPERSDTRPAAPAATDSLVKLMRKSLTESDPVPVALAMMCESYHLFKRYGEREAIRLSQQAEEIAYTWRDRAAVARRDQKLANHTFPAGERACTTDPDSTRPLPSPR